ncbi:MAG: M48 family metallopeptidase [Clostridiales bacterium]|nr:M48 family metallopeptidase [Clostridiales bacterium]
MDFVLKKSKRKTVAIEIAPDSTLIVRAPLYFTEQQARKVINNSKNWIEKKLPQIKNKSDAINQLTKSDIILAKNSLKTICKRIANEYAPLMNVKYTDIKITSAKKRFGSCAFNNNLCFSFYLMLQPYDAIKYVVVHELAHIKHKNHSRAFYSFTLDVLPDADNFEKLLQPQFASYNNLKENIKRA